MKQFDELMNESEEMLAVYRELRQNPNSSLAGVKLYHSDIYYIKYLLNTKFGKRYTAKDVEKILVEEGMLNKDGSKLKPVESGDLEPDKVRYDG